MGEMHLDCAELYFEYGNALLAQAEASGNVFGQAVEQAKENEEKEKEKVALAATKTQVKDEDEIDSESDDDGSSDSSDENGEGEEEDPLKLAWENLDIARVLYEKALPATTVQLSDTLLRMADLSAELGNIEEALKDYARSLDIRVGLSPPDPRRVAEVYIHVLLFLASSLLQTHDYGQHQRTQAGHASRAQALSRGSDCALCICRAAVRRCCCCRG